MFDITSLGVSLNLFMVFLEGLLSFFSPCVLPLLPIYMGYLASSQKEGVQRQRHIFFLTLMFVVGIFLAIFIFHVIISLLHVLIQDYAVWISRVAGILIIFLGIYQLGFVRLPFMERTHQLTLKKKRMNAGGAFLLGFVFSFAWTPCIGPALTSILLFASSAGGFVQGSGYVIIYAIGFGIPFLFVGAFTQHILRWIAKHKNVMRYTVRAGAIIMICIGLLMVTGNYQGINTNSKTTNETPSSSEIHSKDDASIDFTAQDQYGNTIKISDYQGKVVFLNFWATWCPPCQSELPQIQTLYDKYKDNSQVRVLTVINLAAEEGGKAEVLTYLNEHQYTFPVLFDEGNISNYFNISAYPTTFMLDVTGAIYGYIPGALEYDMMEHIIAQTLENKK